MCKNYKVAQNSDPSSLVIQDSFSPDSKISNGIHEINKKKTNSTYKSEPITTTNKSNLKSLLTKNSIISVGVSLVKHLTGSRISRKKHVKIKTNPGATTEDIIDYIEPSIQKKPDFLLVHSGTNDLTNGINTMTKFGKLLPPSKIRKVVANVENSESCCHHRKFGKLLPASRKWIMTGKLSWVFLQLLVENMLTKLMKL